MQINEFSRLVEMGELSERDAAVLNAVLYPNLPFNDSFEASQVQDFEEDTTAVSTTKQMEIDAVKLAEDGKLDEAVKVLDDALAIAPRASIYNNRAHVYQFQKKFAEALDDLNKAIELARGNQKKTLSQALCQRGVLHRKSSRFDLAKDDFEAAALLGNQFAKSQLVELNPYAALCNQMLRKVMDAP